MAIRSISDREKPAADIITANCQAEAVSQNAVEARAWIRREKHGRLVSRNESLSFQSQTRKIWTDSNAERRSSGLTRNLGEREEHARIRRNEGSDHVRKGDVPAKREVVWEREKQQKASENVAEESRESSHIRPLIQHQLEIDLSIEDVMGVMSFPKVEDEKKDKQGNRPRIDCDRPIRYLVQKEKANKRVNEGSHV
jgi:hypothetical protein